MQDKAYKILEKSVDRWKMQRYNGQKITEDGQRSFSHAEIDIRRKTEYGYDDEHGHDDVHAFCDVHMLLAIVLRCFETNLIFTNGSEDASRFFIAFGWLSEEKHKGDEIYATDYQ